MLFRSLGIYSFECDTAGADKDYPLPAKPGGRSCKVVQYSARIISIKGAPKLGFKIQDSPDGLSPIIHTTIASVTVGNTAWFRFDSNSSIILNEFLHPTATIGGTATGDHVSFELFEMRKPF